MLEGSCHCGAVQVRVSVAPETAIACNCSICHRYGALWTHQPSANVTVTAADGTLVGYQWGDRMIEFQHCSRCGCMTHYTPTASGSDRFGVNLRMMRREDIAGIGVRHFDGADSWEFLDE